MVLKKNKKNAAAQADAEASVAVESPTKVAIPKDLLFYDDQQVAETGYARILITAPPKAGKTVSVVSSAPGPVVVLNCDGGEALVPARRHGGKFRAVDIDSARTWDLATKAVVKMAEAGECRTCVVDTITLLAGNVLQREMALRFTGFDVYSQVENAIMSGLNRLLAAPCHLFVLAHITKEDGVGILPDVPGKAKRMVAGLLSDWIGLSYDPQRDPQRAFVVGPFDGWRGHGRNVKRAALVPASVPDLFEELDIAP